MPKDSPGICLHGCSGDDSCPKGMKCCSNGCGYVCKKPVFKVSTNQPRVGQGCQQHPSGLCWNRGLLTCLPHMGIRKTPRERGWRQQGVGHKCRLSGIGSRTHRMSFKAEGIVFCPRSGLFGVGRSDSQWKGHTCALKGAQTTPLLHPLPQNSNPG